MKYGNAFDRYVEAYDNYDSFYHGEFKAFIMSIEDPYNMSELQIQEAKAKIKKLKKLEYYKESAHKELIEKLDLLEENNGYKYKSNSGKV